MRLKKDACVRERMVGEEAREILMNTWQYFHVAYCKKKTFPTHPLFFFFSLLAHEGTKTEGIHTKQHTWVFNEGGDADGNKMLIILLNM